MNQPIHRLKVTLRGVRPAVWRRIEASADTSLFDLHRVLQAAMGWTDSHLHQFIIEHVLRGARSRIRHGRPSANGAPSSGILEHPRDRLVYEYDFGDSWEHDVVLEDIAEAQPEARYPRVIGGRRVCPPEDVGGYPGYNAFVEAISDPNHEEHDSMLAWVGGRFDPERFDLIAANDRVPKRRASLRRDA
jgi:hypothetical protein